MINQFSPSLSTSAMSPTGVPRTGVPQAIASKAIYRGWTHLAKPNISLPCHGKLTTSLQNGGQFRRKGLQTVGAQTVASFPSQSHCCHRLMSI